MQDKRQNPNVAAQADTLKRILKEVNAVEENLNLTTNREEAAIHEAVP